MLDPDDLIAYELCFPGAVTGAAEINCPHCGECSGEFSVDWVEQKVTWER
jgi:hypothetical protein